VKNYSFNMDFNASLNECVKSLPFIDRLKDLGPVVQKPINANLGLNLLNLGLHFNPRLLCVVQR
jgi:hypothetical protein